MVLTLLSEKKASGSLLAAAADAAALVTFTSRTRREPALALARKCVQLHRTTREFLHGRRKRTCTNKRHNHQMFSNLAALLFHLR